MYTCPRSRTILGLRDSLVHAHGHLESLSPSTRREPGDTALYILLMFTVLPSAKLTMVESGTATVTVPVEDIVRAYEKLSLNTLPDKKNQTFNYHKNEVFENIDRKGENTGDHRSTFSTTFSKASRTHSVIRTIFDFSTVNVFNSTRLTLC